MAKAYWVATYRAMKNPDAMAAYAKLSRPAIEAAGGRVLARGMPVATFELRPDGTRGSHRVRQRRARQGGL